MATRTASKDYHLLPTPQPHQLTLLDLHPSPSPLGLWEKEVPLRNKNEDLSLSKLWVLRFLIGLSESLVPIARCSDKLGS